MSLAAPSPQDDLLLALVGFERNFFGFLFWAFPWGEGELAGMDGPEAWQAEIALAIDQGLLTVDEAVKIAIASGHGIGKSAFVAWLILWAISTKVDTRGVVTANTENQLRTKTWAELGKWHRLFIGSALFTMTATAIFSADRERTRTWRIDMVPWSEKNVEAFAGLHNQGKRVVLIFDEASAIPDLIWETSSGVLTDANTQIIWFCAGNPTRNSGRFYECFTSSRSTWTTKQIDARQVRHTNHKEHSKWIAEYGEDSDFVRVRVRGVFPRQGMNEFISGEVVREAAERDLEDLQIPADEPWVLGVDVARFGDDASVIYPRRGRDARSGAFRQFQGISTMQLVDEILRAMNDFRTRLVAVDEGGVGGGVVDRLRQLGVDCIPVDFGAKSWPRQGREVARYANKRAEIWGSLRDWLRGGAIPDDPQLSSELTAPLYTINLREEIVLERKDSMRARGVPSPNIADALAITMAVDTSFATSEDGAGAVHGVDFNPYEGLRAYV